MKNRMLSGLVLSLAAGVLLCGGKAEAKEGKNVIPAGVFADEVELSGLTKEEAEKAIADYVESRAEEKLTLQIVEDALEITRGELGVSWNNPEIVEEALSLGKSGNLVSRYKELKDLTVDNKVYGLTYTSDEQLISEVVSGKCTKYNRDAVDLGLKKTGSGFEVIDGSQGIVVDEEAATEEIGRFVAEEFSEGNTQITIPTKITEPKGSREELAKVKDVLGSFTTAFKTSTPDRCTNLATGAKHINGTVVYPGETFSVYEAASPFTIKNGYAVGGAYLNGKVVDSIGGGICQVSTTLYNAVLLSELEVVQRQPHSMLVTYVQESADAAIAGTYKDFKFKNSTDAPIYIEGYTTKDKTITFKIYGQETRPSNRKVTYTNKVLSRTPAATQLVADGGQGIGFRRVESGHNGCVAELYKNVYIDGKLQSTEKVNKSSYMVSNRTVIYGVNGDPAQSAALQQCIAAGDEAGANAVIGR